MSITDAVGHQVAAALLATLLVGGLRNGRRKGLDLAEQARYANDCAGRERRARPVRHRSAAAGRPAHRHRRRSSTPGTRSRCGCATAGWRRSTLRIEPPFGVVPGKSFDVQPFPLEPGDRIVLLTDGMQERNAVNLDVAAALADSADLHPREVVHELGAAVLHATGGDLRDDATMVCLDWYGGPPRGRNSEQGADPDRASAAV